MVKVMHNKALYLLILAGLLIPTSNVYADGDTTDFSITVNPSLTLSLSSNAVSFTITPDADGEYNSANFTVTSATNNVYGYTLLMTTDKINLESNTINPTTGTKPTISTLAETQAGISAADFAASTDSSVLNHYGVAIGANNFNAMKPANQVKKTTENNTTADATTISLASKLDLLTVPGVYSTILNFQIVANPQPGTLEDAFFSAGKSKTTIGNNQYYAMQDMTTAICNAVTITGDTMEVFDNRDNTIYHIGKLADNRCWLLDNLALNLVDGNVQNTLNPSNTNANQTAIDALLNGGRIDGDSSTYGLAKYGVDTANLSTNSSWYGKPLVYTASKDTVPQGNDPIASVVSTGGWKVGVYYNYCAASAGSFCYGSDNWDEGSPVDIAGSAIDAIYDICPAGWRIPTGYSYDVSPHEGEYNDLLGSYTGTTVSEKYVRYRTAFHLPLSGVYGLSGVADLGDEGSFWTATYSDKKFMSIMHVDTDAESSMYGLEHSVMRFSNYSVRCIAK